jgi:putative ABC transport system ATP-binding protein
MFLAATRRSILVDLSRTFIKIGVIFGSKLLKQGTGGMIVTISHLVKQYHKGRHLIPAVNDVSFQVDRGQFISIVGKSGSGKSTLLNLIGGLDTASSGRIVCDGRDLSAMNRLDLARHRRFTVGMVFQSFNLIPHRSALANVGLALIFGGVSRNKRRDRAADLLAQVGLGHRLGHLPAELSGGEAQRVAIARALANDPSILLADEPTGNLDSGTSKEIIDLLRQLNRERGLTILMVTHELDTARTVSDGVIQLFDGKIVDPPQQGGVDGGGRA